MFSFQREMMKALYIRDFFLDILIQKFLAYGRKFCHFHRNSLIWLFPLLRGRNDEYRKDAEFYFRNSDLEISGIWQKFLPFYPEIIYFDHFRCSEGEMMNAKKMRNKILDILIQKFLTYGRNFCHRNFCHMSEISRSECP